jgi:hypothetical protein
LSSQFDVFNMKKLLFFPAILLTMNVLAQELPVEPDVFSILRIYDSIYTWKLDTADMTWEIDTRDIDMFYNDELNLESHTLQTFDGNEWINYKHYINTYNVNHNSLSNLVQQWSGSTWENLQQIIFTYDENYRRTSSLYQNWNGSYWENDIIYRRVYDNSGNITNYSSQFWQGGNWINNNQTLYFYDENNHETRDTHQTWADTVWINYFQRLLEYDENGNKTIVSNQEWGDNDWYFTYRDVYTYNENNNNILRINQNWDNGSWVDSGRSIMTYDENGDMVHSLFQVYSSVSGWKDTSQGTYTYDAGHNETSYLDQGWYNDAWVTIQLIYSTYDENNFMKSHSNRIWWDDGVLIYDADSTFNYFYTVVGLNEVSINDQQVLVYPNPVTTQLTIELQEVASSMYSDLYIYNLNGQLIFSGKISGHLNTVDVSFLPRGIYFVNVFNEMKIMTGKFVKQ